MKSMPNWMSWPCASIGVLFIAWGFLSSKMDTSTGPALLFIACFAGLVGSVTWQYNIEPINPTLSDNEPQKNVSSTLPKLKSMIPHLQVTPLDIEERPNLIFINFNILNDSDYLAKNILFDIKFGDSLWKKEAWKSSSIDLNNQLLKEKNDPLMASILSETSEQKLKEMLKDYHDSPAIRELKPWAKVKLSLFDENKDFLVKQKMYFASGGKSIPIDPQESSSYLASQGWKEQIDKSENGKPIEISIYVSWENEKGKLFVQIIKYHLIITKIKTGSSHKFLPAGDPITKFD